MFSVCSQITLTSECTKHAEEVYFNLPTICKPYSDNLFLSDGLNMPGGV